MSIFTQNLITCQRSIALLTVQISIHDETKEETRYAVSNASQLNFQFNVGLPEKSTKNLFSDYTDRVVEPFYISTYEPMCTSDSCRKY